MDRLNERLGIDKFNAFMKGLVPPAKKENGKERQEEIMPELVLTRDSFRPASSGMDDADIMSSIPQEFFQDDFDATRYILENLPEKLDDQTLEAELNKKVRAMDVVDSKLSDVIMENYQSFVQGMQRVHEFGADLRVTNLLLESGRRYLQSARKDLTGGGFQIVSKARKSRVLTGILSDVQAIKSISVQGTNLSKAMESGDYPLAIELCKTCLQESNRMSRFQSVAEMPAKYQEIFETIEDKLESKLTEACRKFRPEVYNSVLVGFRLLGKSARVATILEDGVKTLMGNTTHDIALETTLKQAGGDGGRKSSATTFKDVCASIREDEAFFTCARRIFESCANMMLNYYAIIRWHEQQNDGSTNENQKFFADVEMRLQKSKKAVYDEMQRRISVFLQARNCNNMKLESFLGLLGMTNKFSQIGDCFVGASSSTTLRNCVSKMSEAYFRQSHHSRMEDLRAMLENEAWHPCPVQPNFSIKHMKEFDSIGNVKLSADPSSMRIFEEHLDKGFSFADDRQAKREAAIAAAEAEAQDEDDEEISEELRRDFVDEQTGEDADKKKAKVVAKGPSAAVEKAVTGPLLATATINVIRLIGRYLSMIELFSSISKDVTGGLIQIVEYYIYSVFKFFTGDTGTRKYLASPTDNQLPFKVRACLLTLQEKYDEAEGQANAAGRFTVPSLSGMVPIKMASNLYGLSSRVVGIESLLFLHSILHAVKERFEHSVPASDAPTVLHFYNSTVDMIKEIRTLMYRMLAKRFINTEPALNLIASTNWDIAMLGTSTSPYVGVLLKEYENFRDRMQKEPSLKIVPAEVQNILWYHSIINAMETIVEGYSRAKKCSPGGRGQMQLDAKVFMSELEKLTTLRPIPHFNFLDKYIKAYYLSENELEHWILTSKEYTPKQMQAVFNVGVFQSMQKKQRAKYEAMLFPPSNSKAM